MYSMCQCPEGIGAVYETRGVDKEVAGKGGVGGCKACKASTCQQPAM